MAKTRGWCITKFLGDDDDVALTPEEWMETLKAADPEYCIFQLEKAPTTGRLHYQTWIYFANARKKATVINKFKPAHVEAQRGDNEQCIAYNSKEDTRVAGPWEWGRKPKQGERRDLQDVVDFLQENPKTGPLELLKMAGSTYVRNKRALDSVMLMLQPPRAEKPFILTIVGKTGVGKTRFVYDHFKSDAIYTKGNLEMYFESYRNQPICLLDDYRGALNFAFLLNLLDRYPLTVPVKGTSAIFNSEVIIITSNDMPSEWYDLTPVKLAPLMRRLEADDGSAVVATGQQLLSRSCEWVQELVECRPSLHPYLKDHCLECSHHLSRIQTALNRKNARQATQAERNDALQLEQEVPPTVQLTPPSSPEIV